ncbi:MAG: hypothetical protein VX278_20765, partial [Myxococcota bacterium]|nr:hypothetical protein [Myxococcota bacterium]
MGTSLAEISSFLENLGFRYGVDDAQNHIVTAFSTEEYTDYEGDYHLQIVIQLRDKGEFIQVFTPRCYC